VTQAIIGFAVLAGSAAIWTVCASLAFLYALGLQEGFSGSARLWAWWLYALEAPPNAIVHRWLWISGMVAGLGPLLIGAIAFMQWNRKGNPSADLYGKSSWASRRDLARNSIRTDRGAF
jgi:hypothetical protein